MSKNTRTLITVGDIVSEAGQNLSVGIVMENSDGSLAVVGHNFTKVAWFSPSELIKLLDATDQTLSFVYKINESTELFELIGAPIKEAQENSLRVCDDEDEDDEDYDDEDEDDEDYDDEDCEDFSDEDLEWARTINEALKGFLLEVEAIQ
jgi:hypothetical protein